jgi:N-acyl homoserine lactone hydrolase
MKFYKLSIFFILILMVNCTDNKFEFYALRYGSSQFPLSKIFYNDKSENDTDFAWLFYLIKIDKRIILIDTGFDDERYTKLYDMSYKKPTDVLNELNIKPYDVTDVILTHSHFDHIGSIDKFNNAKIYIQQDELQDVLSRPSTKYARYLKDNQRVNSFGDAMTLFNKIKIRKIGGHTVGSSIVSFEYNKKDYVIVGDEFYMLENIKKQIPTATYFNLDNNKKLLIELNDKKYNIFTMHDPGIVAKNKDFKKIIP